MPFAIAAAADPTKRTIWRCNGVSKANRRFCTAESVAAYWCLLQTAAHFPQATGAMAAAAFQE
eukprot:CAMPEP_0172836458 /NCGR_PEP_ID=MMETSP1075-20121228/26499_1 /TAXON_ID=2916 /ORGANISM="Ceratium fusus, Strain PA161109" /LENGTH=62 /DNA_ID=CAMNT_0013679685 /DNA_START=218 /DNA_END=406 /DNA_ORIENTATION=-